MKIKTGFGVLMGVAVLLAAVLQGCGHPATSTTRTALPGAPAARSSPADAGDPASPAWLSDLSATTLTYPSDGLTLAKLKNGLTVIVKESRILPVVDVRCYVRTGSMHEGRFMGAGISHLCEHLVAEGAEHNMGPGQTAEESRQQTDRVTQIGGQSNASTSIDTTTYYISAASSKASECIDLVSDWMIRPQITMADFQREHGVVQRELELGKNSPQRLFAEASSANTYQGHPAGVPVIGYSAPLAALTYEDVLAYHAATYVPQNMVFVVIGDVQTSQVITQIADNFAKFPAGRAVVHNLPEVPSFSGVRRAIMLNPRVDEAMEDLAFQTIPLVHNDLYALDVLSYILTEGDSSRLFTRLMHDRKLVTEITSSSYTPEWGKGVFEFSYRSAPEKAQQAEDALIEQLRLVVAKGVTKNELDRAKRQKLAELVYQQQSVGSLASMLATDFMSTANIHFTRDYVNRIQKVTPEQVHAVARKYFDFNNMVITRMAPPPEAGAEAGAATRTAARTEAQVFTLPNGLRVILQPVTSDTPVGLVSMVLVSKGGVMLEDASSNGIGNLMTEMTTKGAGKYSSQDISSFFDRVGGSIGASCGNSGFNWSASVLSDSFGGALDIFAQVVQHPTFPAGELEVIRPVVQTQIERIDAEWYTQLAKFFREDFFKDSPYQFLSLGQTDVVKSATAAQLKDYHKKHVLAGSSVLAVYGQFDVQDTRKKIEKLFGGMEPGKVRIPAYPAPKVPPAGELRTKQTKTQLAAVIVAAPAMTVFDINDRVPLDVLDTIISGWYMPSGWLHNELRGQQLVYVVHALTTTGLAPGAFYAYAAGQPANQQKIVDTIVKDFKAASRYTPKQTEIDEAVNTILTAELLQNQSLSNMASRAAMYELLGFGYDFDRKLETLYRAVKPEDVARVGKKYLGNGYAIYVTTPDTKDVRNPQAATRPAAAIRPVAATRPAAASKAAAGATTNPATSPE